jgi:hypothetical protein
MGQPDMKGKHAGLGAEADEGKNKYQQFGRMGKAGCFETETAGMPIEDPEGRKNKHGPTWEKIK